MIDLDQVALDAARQLTPANDVQARATVQCAIISALRRALPAEPEAVRLRDELRERTEFEAWAKRHDYDITRYEDEPNRYLNKHSRDAWDSWQAALAETGKQQVGEVQGLDVQQLKNLVSSVHRTVSLGHQRGPYAYSGEDFGRYLAEAARDCRQIMVLLDALAARQSVEKTFQAGVSEWMGQCFLPSLYSNMTERGDRLLEEVLELLQSNGYDQSRVATLVSYVFNRPTGEPSQEVGGVMVTLAGYCWVAGLDMHAAGDAELLRITRPKIMEKIRRKQEAKNALHFDTPLPGNSAPPAQAVDLGQFRVQVAELLRSEFDLEAADPEDHRHDDGQGEAERLAARIAALIDGQAVQHG